MSPVDYACCALTAIKIEGVFMIVLHGPPSTWKEMKMIGDSNSVKKNIAKKGRK